MGGGRHCSVDSSMPTILQAPGLNLKHTIYAFLLSNFVLYLSLY